MEYCLEEWNAHMVNYKNQGLYPNYGDDINLVNLIRSYGNGAGIYGQGNQFAPTWWHFIYKIPRLW